MEVKTKVKFQKSQDVYITNIRGCLDEYRKLLQLLYIYLTHSRVYHFLEVKNLENVRNISKHLR